jgi:hypothetical protein
LVLHESNQDAKIYKKRFHKAITCRVRPKETNILKRRGSKKWQLNLVPFLVMPLFKGLTQGKESCQKLYMDQMIYYENGRSLSKWKNCHKK